MDLLCWCCAHNAGHNWLLIVAFTGHAFSRMMSFTSRFLPCWIRPFISLNDFNCCFLAINRNTQKRRDENEYIRHTFQLAISSEYMLVILGCVYTFSVDLIPDRFETELFTLPIIQINLHIKTCFINIPHMITNELFFNFCYTDSAKSNTTRNVQTQKARVLSGDCKMFSMQIYAKILCFYPTVGIIKYVCIIISWLSQFCLDTWWLNNVYD